MTHRINRLSAMEMKMHRNLKLSLFCGVAALVIGGVAMPANADPINPNPTTEAEEVPLVGVGSETTQDLFTGLTQAVTDAHTGGTVFASYDAGDPSDFPPEQIRPRVLGTTFSRPFGSVEGLNALRSAVQGTEWTALDADGNVTGVVLHGSDIQFARSSVYVTPVIANALYAQIPIAADAMTYATNGGAGGTQIPQGIPVGDTPTAAAGTPTAPDPLNLSNIFLGKGYLEGTIQGKGYKFFSGAGDSTDAGFPKLDVYVPPVFSDSRAIWYSALLLGDISELSPGVQDLEKNGSLNQADDGSAVDGDPLAIEPYSVAQWIGQSRAGVLNPDYGISITDRRHNAVLNAVSDADGNLVQPEIDGIANVNYPISHPVFVNIEYAQLTINSYLEGAFVNDSNSAVSSTIYDATNPATGDNEINDFGFAKIPAGGFQTPVYPGVTFLQGDAADYRFN